MNGLNRDSFRRLPGRCVPTRRRTRAELFPPATISEVAWDILLVLSSERHGALDLDRLGCLVSARSSSISDSLSDLDQRRLISFRAPFPDGKPQPALTRAGRDLLDNYLAAASDLQFGEARSVR